MIHSRKFMMRSGTVVGSFKIDLKTVYDAPGRYLLHEIAISFFLSSTSHPVFNASYTLCPPPTHQPTTHHPQCLHVILFIWQPATYRITLIIKHRHSIYSDPFDLNCLSGFRRHFSFSFSFGTVFHEFSKDLSDGLRMSIILQGHFLI